MPSQASWKWPIWRRTPASMANAERGGSEASASRETRTISSVIIADLSSRPATIESDCSP
jgi:hypothetical protein